MTRREYYAMFHINNKEEEEESEIKIGSSEETNMKNFFLPFFGVKFLIANKKERRRRKKGMRRNRYCHICEFCNLHLNLWQNVEEKNS